MLSNTTVSFKGVDETDIRTANDKFGIYKRTLKVIEIGTNRKPVWDFLLVFHCNLPYVVSRYWSTIWNIQSWPPVFSPFLPSLVWSPHKLHNGEKRTILRLLVLTQYQRVMDNWARQKIHERLNIFKTFCLFLFISLLTVWLSGNTLASINVVALRQTRLVLGWVTVCGRVNHLGM